MGHQLDIDDELTTSFRRSAAALLAAFDPHLAAGHIHPTFTNAPGPLHCPRCARPSMTTRSISLRSKKTTGTGRQAQAQNTTRVRRASRAVNKQHLLVRQCALCQYEHKRALSKSHGNNDHNGDGDNGSLPPPSVPDAPTQARVTMLENNSPTKRALHIDNMTSTSKESTLPESSSNSDRKHSAAFPSKRPLSAAQNSPTETQAKADDAPPLPSKRTKKKAGLAAMLDRSKQQQREKEKQAESAGSGLASFLSTL